MPLPSLSPGQVALIEAAIAAYRKSDQQRAQQLRKNLDACKGGGARRSRDALGRFIGRDHG